jgi:DNA-binding MarR family transcriptional regulator
MAQPTTEHTEANRPFKRFVTYRVLRLHLAMNAQSEEILARVAQISLAQWRVLSMVGGGVTTSRGVVTASGFDPGYISKNIRKLELAGMITAERLPEDRRTLALQLTDKGAEIYERTFPIMQARQEAMLGSLTSAERDVVFNIIDKLEIATEQREFEQ